MAIDQRLRELAERYGIVPEYYDIWGNHHCISAQTARALLAAMGIAGADDGELAACESRQADERILAPVQVVSVGEAIAVDIIIAQAFRDRILRWRVDK